MRKFTTKAFAGALAFAMVFGAAATTAPNTASAAKVKVTKVTATAPSGKTAEVAKGKKVKISTTVKATPNKAANKKVTYKSANTKVATVSSKGAIKGIKAGSTKITVTSTKNAKKKATVKVKVMSKAVTKVSLNATKATLAIGGKKTLKAAISPSKNASKKVVWSTSNKKVATVTSKGVVKGVKGGTATITAKAADGSGKKATCKVTVGVGIASVTVLNGNLIRVTLTSAKALTAANFVVQTKKTPGGSYNETLAVDKIRSTDNKVYDVVLDSHATLDWYSYLKVTISALSVDKSKEIYVSNVPDSGNYEVNDTETIETGTVGQLYNGYSYGRDWYISNSNAVGSVKYTVSNLPAGLKAYTSKSGTSVRVAGRFTKVLNGEKATLTGIDEAGKKFTRTYTFYVGDKDHMVGTVLPSRTRLAYVPDDPATKLNEESGAHLADIANDIANAIYDDDDNMFYVAGGSGSRSCKVTGVPASHATYNNENDCYESKEDAKGKYVAEAAGTFSLKITVTDSSNHKLEFNYPVTLTAGVTVTGTVKDAAGQPAKHITVYGRTKRDKYGRYDDLSQTTLADGTYKVRTVPGDYYMHADPDYYSYYSDAYTDASVGNKLTSGTVTKDFSIPFYLVKFTTNIANAKAYSVYSDLRLFNANGESYDIYSDSETDFGLYAYLRAGSYELQPTAAENSSANTVRAYTKYNAPTGDSIDPSLPSNEDEAYLGTFTLAGSFNVAGNATVQLTGTKYTYTSYEDE